MRAYKGVVRRVAVGGPLPPAWLPASETAIPSTSRQAALSSATSTSTEATGANPRISSPPASAAAESRSSPRRKRRLPSASASAPRPVGALSRWGRVVPASQRMLEFLGATAPPTRLSSPAAATTSSSSSPSSVFSVLQLARFYLGSGDLRAAQEVLYALQDGRLSGLQVTQLPAGLLRPLYQTLISELCRRGEAAAAVEAARRMLRSSQGGQPPVLGQELLAKLIRTCGRGGGSAGELLMTVLVELGDGANEQGAWRAHAESCRALVETLAGLQPNTHQASNANAAAVAPIAALPSLEEAWQALVTHGPPPLAAHRTLIEGLASRVGAAGDGAGAVVEQLMAAVDEYAEAAQALPLGAEQQDTKERARVLVAVGMALLGHGQQAADPALLRHALRTLAVPGETRAYVALMAQAKGHLLLDAVFEAAQEANPGPLSLGLILGYCRSALGQPAEAMGPALNRALALLRGLEAGAAWAAEVRAGDVAGVLDVLCEQGLGEEARALQQLAGPTLPSPPPVDLARALLKCAALEGRPGRAIALLHRLVAEGQEQKQQPADYEAVLGALARMELPPPTEREAALGREPLDFLAWAFEGLGRTFLTSGQEQGPGQGGVTPTAVRLGLEVLRRACEWPEEDDHTLWTPSVPGRHREALVQRAFALVSRLVAQGHETDDALCEALVGVAVWGVSLQRAADVVRQMEGTGAAKPVLARAQALLVGSLAARGLLMEAEEGLVKMVTLTGQGPTPRVLDAFARGYALEGNVPSGLSMLQGCFTQYGARPSPAAFERLFVRCLEEGDKYEAQRAVTIAQQIWAGEGEEGLAWVQGLEARLAGHDFSPASGSAGGDGVGDEEKEKEKEKEEA